MAETLSPSSLAELEQAVAWALSAERPLAVTGRGSKRGLGAPVDASAELRLDRMAGIDLYEPAELVMSAGAGTPLVEIEATLAERHQELAFEPADYGLILGGAANQQSVGGTFACNLSGPRRLKAGAARDHLLGVHCVTGLGQAIKTGGRVMKNVTGYDLCKLLTGSYGTLAVMGRLTFKVMPAAPDAATLLLRGDDVALLLEALRTAMGTSCDVAGAAVLPAAAAARSGVPAVAAAGSALAALRVEGPENSVRYRLDALERVVARRLGLDATRLDRAATRALWREIRDVRLLDPALPVLWRASVPPTEAAGLAAGVAPLEPELLFDWSGGLVWIAHRRADGDAGATLVRGSLGTAGGHATLVRAPEAARRATPPFQPQPALLQGLSQRVKSSFDPKGILNPGRMYPGF
ncbi:MAG: FAD-binding protein [Geminicoccaceae bacterium]